MKYRDNIINISVGIFTIAHALRSVLLTNERQTTMSIASTVAEWVVISLLFALGGAFLIKFKKPLVRLVSDRLMIFLVGLNTAAVIASYLVSYGLTPRTLLLQLPSILILGVVAGWFVRCTRNASHR